MPSIYWRRRFWTDGTGWAHLTEKENIAAGILDNLTWWSFYQHPAVYPRELARTPFICRKLLCRAVWFGCLAVLSIDVPPRGPTRQNGNSYGIWRKMKLCDSLRTSLLHTHSAGRHGTHCDDENSHATGFHLKPCWIMDRNGCTKRHTKLIHTEKFDATTSSA